MVQTYVLQAFRSNPLHLPLSWLVSLMPAYDVYRTRSYSTPGFLFFPSILKFRSFHCLRKCLYTLPCVLNFILVLAEQPNTRNIHCRSFGWNSSVPPLDEAHFLVDSSGRGDGLSQSSTRALLCMPVRGFPHQIIWNRKTYPTSRSHFLVASLSKGTKERSFAFWLLALTLIGKSIYTAMALLLGY